MYQLLDIPETRSSLINGIEYNEDTQELVIHFRKYYVDKLTYLKVPVDTFVELMKAKSIGKFYLHNIKPNFHLKTEQMADRPKTVNRASKEKRFIKFSINVKEINKEWLNVGEKGVYLNATLALLPDGELDQFGNLGMITQDVPKAVYEKEKGLKAEKRSRGSILGNAAEFERKGAEGAPGTETGVLMATAPDDVADDLPF